MPHKRKLPDCTVLKRLYVDKEMSMDDIGDIYGVSRAGVKFAMKKCSIPGRTKSEARILALDKGKFEIYPNTFDKHFFDKFDERSAWALGVVYACGNVIRKERLDLTIAKDTMWVMEKLCEMMQVEHVVWEDNDWDMQIHIILQSTEMCTLLREIGFPKSKRRDFGLPNIPVALIKHFVRGYLTRRGLVSYSRHFLEEVAGWMTSMGVENVTIVGVNEFAIVQTPEIIDILEEG